MALVIAVRCVLLVMDWRSSSNVRHPRCVLYNSKQLGMLTLTVEHNYMVPWSRDHGTL